MGLKISSDYSHIILLHLLEILCPTHFQCRGGDRMRCKIDSFMPHFKPPELKIATVYNVGLVQYKGLEIKNEA